VSSPTPSPTAPAEYLLAEIPSESPEDLQNYFEARGWGDGLPLVAPTPERVAAMLEHAPGDPDECLAVFPPRNGRATRRMVAVNAVLAGCRPAVMPVLVAATRLLGDPAFNLRGVNATTHPVAPLLIVHGEAVDRCGFNSGSGSFGPGKGVNGVVGRAVRLLLLHVGGARPGDGDQSTQGSPTKYAFCIAENREATPWESYPASLGIGSPSALTIFPGEGPHNIHDTEADNPQQILDKIASTITTLGHTQGGSKGGEFLIVLAPEHAQTIAGRKWGREDIQMYLYEVARLPLARQKAIFKNRNWPRWMRFLPEDMLGPMAVHPDRYRIVVAGGPGKHSVMLPSWGRSITVPLTDTGDSQ